MFFNRAERSWVYRAAKKVDLTIAFGSTGICAPGTVLFANCAFLNLARKALIPVRLWLALIAVGPTVLPQYFICPP